MIACGRVLAAQGGLLEVRLPGVAVGDGVRIEAARSQVRGIVTALRAGYAIVAAHDAIDGIVAGDRAFMDRDAERFPLGTALLGRCIDARANPLDGGPPIPSQWRPAALQAPDPAERAPIEEPFWTGVRALDTLLTIGRGARVGIFGAPGCGKSTLLHALMRGAHADAVVVALIGERGREAEEWIRIAPPHACIVCATSDRSAAERVRAAQVAMAQAHALRARGLHVLAIVDSLARYAAALREVAVAAGEAVGRGGFPVSVFSAVARYVEVAGAVRDGSITLVATVLTDGDERDPLSEAARSLLDGHIELSPALARRGHFPAIDVVASTSRTMGAVTSAAHGNAARAVRRALALLEQTADGRALGIIPAGDALARAVAEEEPLGRFLCQDDGAADPAQSLSRLSALADKLE